MDGVKKVAVIGAGASGLPSIKCCLDEGLEPVCFERTDHIGGLWYYTENAVDGQACVMKSTVINTSKEMTSYSDFPIPKEYPIYMHNTSVLQYFNLYADHFGLKKYIRFKTEVVSVKKRSDFASSGQWDVQIRDKETGKTEDLVFDAIMVCTGHHAEKNEPSFPGLENFKGKVIHSHDYKEPKGYENKRVVVVGIGNSGGDATVELSRVASQLYLSTRTGAWIFNRVFDNGYPVDMQIFKRSWVHWFLLPFTDPVSMWMDRLNSRFDHAVYSLRPKCSPLSTHPTLNDDLPNRIVCGAVIVKPDIRAITEHDVVFEDGTKAENIDVLYFATGYKFGFPFLDKSVIDVNNNNVDLYKWMFPPDLEQPTLCVIGCVQPLGSIMPISENQARLFTRIIKGLAKLPSSKDMRSDIKLKHEVMALRYKKSTRHTIQVDFVPYMDEIAELGGNKPDLFRLFWKDPVLAMKCYFGPCTPYQYRIMGPRAWSGAREAIMKQWERVEYPLRTRPLGFSVEKSHKGLFLLYFLLVVVFAYIVHALFMS